LIFILDLNDPQMLLNDQGAQNPGKEEIVASRYNIQITASDIKRITNSNWFNTKLVDFYTYYLTEKLAQKQSHAHLVALPSMFFNPINPNNQIGEVSAKYQEAIELLIRKSQEISRGEQNIFKLVDRLFFVCNLMKTHWVIIEVQKNTGEPKRNPQSVFESLSII